jgi:1,2-diacylglycerol-3-alpha-glucose alpha-1,2-galactosyltransferase
MERQLLRVQVVSESAFTVRGHGVHSAFEDQVLFLAGRHDIRTVVNGRPRWSSDIVHVHTVGPYSLLLLLLGGRRKIATAHVTAESLIGSVVGAKRLLWLIRRYLRSFYNRTDVVIAVSEHTAGELRQSGVTRPVVVVPNFVRCQGVDSALGRRAQVRRWLGIDEGQVLVVSVGQVQPRKGVSEFLACAIELPKVRFLWAGGAIFGAASAKRSCLEEALRGAPNNVQHTGPVPRDKILGFLAAADIYVSLSRHETFGLAVLEAAAASCPLVLSDLAVFRATYGKAAQYVDAGDPVPLIAKLADDEALRRVWGARAREVAARYDWRHGGKSLMSVYREVTEPAEGCGTSSR